MLSLSLGWLDINIACLRLFLFWRELSDLQKENAVSQTAAQEAAINAQSSAREEVKELLDMQKTDAHREKDALLLQVCIIICLKAGL